MVTFRPYAVQTQASSISQQNSGGNGYIGNESLQALGQTIAGVGERALGIDDATIQRKQQHEVNRNKFEAEIERREQEQYIQSQRLEGMAKLADLDIEIGAEAEDLKSKVGSGGQDYAKSVTGALDKKIGTIQKNLSFEQKRFLEPQLLDFKNRHLSKAMTWERTERINNDIANVEKYQKSLYDRINDNPESVNEAKTQMTMLVDNLTVEPSVKRKLLDSFDDTVTQLHYDYRIETNPEAFLNEFKKGDASNFDTAINHILDLEGGYVASDGRSNSPANFGINQKANPDIDVKNLTKEQAKAIYKERYWDSINADSLPENIRLIAMDTAVNQGVGVAQELIGKSNNDPAKFTQLRIEHYKSLNQPENEIQWINRANKTLKASQVQSAGVLEREYVNKALPLVEKMQRASIKLAINNGELSYKDIQDNPNISDADKFVYMTTQKKYNANIAKAETQAVKKQKEKYNGFIEKTKQEVDNNLWSVDKLDAIRKDIETSDYDAIKKRIEAKDEAVQLETAFYNAPAGSDNQVKAVNYVFNKEKTNIFNAQIPIDERINNANKLLSDSRGVVPSEMKSIMQNMATKPNADNIEFLNGVYQNAKINNNKAVLSNLSDDIVIMSQTYQDYLESGNSPQQALTLLNSELNITAPQKKERGDLGKNIINEAVNNEGSFIAEYGNRNGFLSSVASLFGYEGVNYSSLVASDPVYSEVESDAKAKFLSAFMKTGNQEKSLDMAFDYVQKTYSKFNGKLMKYAPDVVTGFDAGLIENDFQETINQENIVNSLNQLGYSTDDIELISDIETERTVKTRQETSDGVSFKKPLSYLMAVGGLPLLNKNGNILRYKIDVNKFKNEKQKTQIAQKQLQSMQAINPYFGGRF